MFHVMISVAVVGVLLVVSVVQLAPVLGLGALTLVVPLVTPPPLQPLTGPLAVRTSNTLALLDRIGRTRG